MGIFKKKQSEATPARSEDAELVSRAYKLLAEFKSAYAKEWTRLDKCERYYSCKHWNDVAKKDNNEPRPITPSLFSAIESAKADMMERYPQATVLPESPDDKEIADVVSALIRQNHDAAHYKREYARSIHDLFVSGYCVQEVGYDVHANRGIGGAFIRWVDNRNILFDPQATEDIQDCRAIIKITPKTIEWLEQSFPKYKGAFTSDSLIQGRDDDITFDQQKSVLFMDYWWREYDPAMSEGIGGYRVHMAQIAGQRLLADSREVKPEGYFRDGEYPFVVTYLFERKGTPLGYGMVDIHGESQMMADKLDQIVVKNAYMASHNKLLNTEASGFNTDDLRDWSKEVHEGTNVNGVKWFTTPPLPEYLLTHIRGMRNDMSETSGANEVSQGNGSAGVTSAKAIQYLQQASNKRTKTANDRMMDDYKACVVKEIEVEREFNKLPRDVQVTRDGEKAIEKFKSSLMVRRSESGIDMPIEFAVSVKVEVENQWTVETHNALMMSLAQQQMIPAQLALELMIFEGKDTLISKMGDMQTQAVEQAGDQSVTGQQAGQNDDSQAEQEQRQLEEKINGMQAPDAAIV